MSQLIGIGLATLASEDLACIAAGLLVAQGRVGFLGAVAACLVGIWVGDILLYIAGRLAGKPVLALRLVNERRLAQASAWLLRQGAAVVFASRFTPGLRLPAYFAAGLLKVPFLRFAFYLWIAACLWTPPLVAMSAALGERVRGIPFPVAGALALAAWKLAFSYRLRRYLVGFWRRKARWEFWPPYIAYIPVVIYILWLGLKYRSLTLFMEANPGMFRGGFVGESKSRILRQLEGVARFAVVRTPEDALAFGLPAVLKPDVGERGRAVSVVRSEEDVREYFRAPRRTTIVQEYVPGVEFGLFYYRYPGELQGRIFSITEKRFPEVIGDGRRTVRQLILDDPRAVCLARGYLRTCGRAPDDVPAAGEPVRLAELGSHCRGSVFLDGARFRTPALEAVIDRIARSHPGFYFGRFDIRAASAEDFQAGLFKVIELNGVSAEATHIYDPAVSIREAYRVMFKQWRVAFEIGAQCRAAARRACDRPALNTR